MREERHRQMESNGRTRKMDRWWRWKDERWRVMDRRETWTEKRDERLREMVMD